MPARSISIHGYRSRQLLHAGHLVRQRVVAHVAEIRFVKFLGAPRRAHAVDLHHHESQLRQRLAIAARRRKAAAADAAGLRAGINVIDDRIFLAGVEIGRLEHQPVHIGHAVARLHRERNRRLPSRGQQLARYPRFPSSVISLPVLVAHHRNRRHIRLRVTVDEIMARGRQRNVVIGILRRQQLQPAAVEIHAIEVNEVRIAALLSPHGQEIGHAILLIHAQQLRDVAFAGGDLVLQLARWSGRKDKAGPSCRARKTR